MKRISLPNRRASDVMDIEFRDQPYTITYGQHQGRICEIFIDGKKPGSQSHDDSRDIAVILSIALQYGVPIEVIRVALTRLSDGTAAGIGGAVLDALALRGES